MDPNYFINITNLKINRNCDFNQFRYIFFLFYAFFSFFKYEYVYKIFKNIMKYYRNTYTWIICNWINLAMWNTPRGVLYLGPGTVKQKRMRLKFQASTVKRCEVCNVSSLNGKLLANSHLRVIQSCRGV